MTPAALIQSMALDGVRVSATLDRKIKIAGNREAVARWMPILTARKTEIICALSEPPPDMRAFIDDTEERAAIMEYDAPDVYPSRETATTAAFHDVTGGQPPISERSKE